MPTPEEKIAQIAPNLGWRPGPVTDPIWMEYTIEVDPAIRSQLAVARLEMVAAVYRSIADGAANAAKIFAQSRQSTP